MSINFEYMHFRNSAAYQTDGHDVEAEHVAIDAGVILSNDKWLIAWRQTLLRSSRGGSGRRALRQPCAQLDKLLQTRTFAYLRKSADRSLSVADGSSIARTKAQD